ncbi:MAG: putative bifunctional diguanylate cyclase/phosphodiesterase [Rhodoferax sp.]
MEDPQILNRPTQAAAQAAQATPRGSVSHPEEILDNLLGGVVTVDALGLIESVNKAACAIFGYDAPELLGRQVALLFPEPYRSRHEQYLQQFRHSGLHQVNGQQHDLQGQRKDGSRFAMNVAVSQIARAGEPVLIGLVHDMTQHQMDEEIIRTLAYYDPLTNLANRLLLRDRLVQVMLTGKRSGRYGALLFLDLDNFKALNDRHGHATGDLLLIEVARRLTSCVREIDTVARLGGDEFVVLLGELPQRRPHAIAQVEVVAEKLRSLLAQPYVLPISALASGAAQTVEHRCSASIGVELFYGLERTDTDILKSADSAMYQAKAAGRNSIHFYDPAVQAAVAAEAELEIALYLGLTRSEFVLHYQIQVNRHGAPLGAEALVRWNHPQRGLVPPGDFIALAERSSLILQLGQWVLDSACGQLAAWGKRPETQAWTMSLNISVLQFSQTNFVSHVVTALQKARANPQCLMLELTESMLADDVDIVIDKMNALRSIGVKFSMDDFGTGYSSLTYLKRLPLDQIKIDKSFVRDLLTDPDDAMIARVIVTLGHSLELSVLAEGVENAPQRDFLSGLGCDAFQGYYFGRAVPAALLNPR